MDLAGRLTNPSDPLGKPWRMVGTAMMPNTLLMGKLLFLLLLIHRFPGKIDAPFLPFLSMLDAFRAWPQGVEAVLLAAFLGAGVLLLFNVAVRPASVILGLVIIWVMVASKPLFRNHLFICGCLFLLAGLHRPGERAWMIHWQMSLVYAGAFLNKVLDADWHSGQFMHNWLLNARENPFFAAAYTALPDLWLARALSWTAIAMELSMAVFLFVRRTQPLGVWVGLIFHGSLFVFLLGENFGHFLEDILLAYLAFLSWPRAGMAVGMRASVRRRLAPLLRTLDWDRQWPLSEAPAAPTAWLSVTADGRMRRNVAALRYLIRHTTGFYVVLFAGYFAALYLIPPPFGFVAVTLTGGVLLFLFLPISRQ